MKDITVTAPTVEEAVNQALSKLNISKEKAEITIIEQGKKGFLGIFKGKPFVVHVKKIIDPVEEAVAYINDVTAQMGIETAIEVKKTSRQCEIHISSSSIGLLIGKRGQTINALQLLTQLVANRYSKHYFKIILNAENYRERREETLVQLAEKMAHQVLRTNRSVQLETMPAHERKVIHQALAKNKKVETLSVGEEPKRCVLMRPAHSVFKSTNHL
ncbi:RNA-binding cell elongation regulator Jag/EloR [Priestia flexa]|uniref:RNA-binding cell elongation regulator Jag/EloR n=1 Tax=Priestia flexa TaxID=86664 RepID=UPI001F4D2109|nr:RNA-binding cell elongation regulator Jag/EloR [Priestia flexa]